MWRSWEGFNEDRIPLVAAGITLYALLALVPAPASFLSVYGLFLEPQSVMVQIDSLKAMAMQLGSSTLTTSKGLMLTKNSSTPVVMPCGSATPTR